MVKNAELVFDTKAVIGEGPCWDEQRNLLYYVDIMGRKVHVHDPINNTNRSYETEQQIGALVLTQDGSIVVASEKGFNYLDLGTGKFTLIADPKGDNPRTRFNDGKCDPMGRFWAGTMGNGKDPEDALYMLDHNKDVHMKLAGVTISNGLAWSLDNRTMYYIDTVLKRIDAFDYDIETGDISNRRTVVDMDGCGLPDGMTIDSEGMLWAAEYLGSKVSRWNPVTGECVDEIMLPVTNVTSCIFGDKDLKTLYITSALNGLDDAQKNEQKLAGALFKVRANIPGAKCFRYGGKQG